MRKFFGFAIVAMFVCGQAFAQTDVQPSPSDVVNTAQTVVEPMADGMPMPATMTSDCGCGSTVVASSCGTGCNPCQPRQRVFTTRRNNCCVPVSTCAPQCCDPCNNGRRVMARRNNCCNTSCCSVPVSTCAPQCCDPCNNSRRVMARRNNCCNTNCCSVPVSTCAPQTCNTGCNVANDCCNTGRRVLARRSNCCDTGCNVATTTSCCQPVVATTTSNCCGNVVSTGCGTSTMNADCCQPRTTGIRTAVPVRTGGMRLRRGC